MIQIKMENGIDTHGMVCDFGKHKGTLWTRIPASYLLWMVGSSHSKADIAKAELARRGTARPEIELTAHAIDRASMRCHKLWRKTRNDDEGLYSWLARIGFDAYTLCKPDSEGRHHHLGMVFVFKKSEWPTMITVMREPPEKGRR